MPQVNTSFLLFLYPEGMKTQSGHPFLMLTDHETNYRTYFFSGHPYANTKHATLSPSVNKQLSLRGLFFFSHSFSNVKTRGKQHRIRANMGERQWEPPQLQRDSLSDQDQPYKTPHMTTMPSYQYRPIQQWPKMMFRGDICFK